MSNVFESDVTIQWKRKLILTHTSHIYRLFGIAPAEVSYSQNIPHGLHGYLSIFPVSCIEQPQSTSPTACPLFAVSRGTYDASHRCFERRSPRDFFRGLQVACWDPWRALGAVCLGSSKGVAFAGAVGLWDMVPMPFGVVRSHVMES